MARLEVNDIAGLIADFDALGNDMDEVVEQMLTAEAQIVQAAQTKTARSMGVYDDSGRNVGSHVADSIQRGRPIRMQMALRHTFIPRAAGAETIRHRQIQRLHLSMSLASGGRRPGRLSARPTKRVRLRRRKPQKKYTITF